MQSQAQRQGTASISDEQNGLGVSRFRQLQFKIQRSADFSKLKKELKEQLGADATELEFQNIDQNIDKLLGIHGQLTTLLSDYDKKLIQVLARHEHDFLAAYKTHMTKVEKELQYLKSKAKDQERRLAQDERILRLEKQLKWFQDEMARLQKKQEENYNEIDMLSNKQQTMKDEKKFMEDQVKASKRQNKLLIVALNKTQNQKTDLEEENNDLQVQAVETKKATVEMPSLFLSPFDMTAVNMSQQEQQQQVSQIDNQTQQFHIQEINEQNNKNDDQIKDLKNRQDMERSLQASTEFPSELNTSRFKPFESLQKQPQLPLQSLINNDLQIHLNQSNSVQQIDQQDFLPQNIVQQFTSDLIQSGRNEPEIVESLEQYYNKLCKNSDDEIVQLREELEIQKALARELQAEEVVIPAADQDDLSNFFLDCVYEQRKSLRHQLVTMRQKTSNNTSKMNDHSMMSQNGILGGGVNSSRYQPGTSFMNNSSIMNNNPGKTVSNVFNNSLLNTYINTVKTGTQDEIEQFSQIEKQKLVQLLSTNNELLNFMFDKMFKNNKKAKDQNLSNKQNLCHQNLDLLDEEDNTLNFQSLMQNSEIPDNLQVGYRTNTYTQNGDEQNFNYETRGTFSPAIQYQEPSQNSKTVKNSQYMFGINNSSDPYLAFNKLVNSNTIKDRQGHQAPLKDRKQRSMMTADYNHSAAVKNLHNKTQHIPMNTQFMNITQSQSNTQKLQSLDHANTLNPSNQTNVFGNDTAKQINTVGSDIQVPPHHDAYYSASPLIGKGVVTSGKIQQSNILLSRIKESNFNGNMLSQIDTDLLQQQYISQENTILNSQSPKTYYENGKEVVFSRRSKFAQAAENNIIFPDINGRRGSNTGDITMTASGRVKSRPYDDTYTNTEKLLQGSKNLLMLNNTGGKRGKSTRPMMQVKNGKLLLVKAV
eukprot:403355172